MDHIIDHGEYPCSVADHELVEGFGLAGLTSLDQFQIRYIDLSQSRFRFHIRREPELFHSTAFNGCRNGVAIRRDIHPSD